MTNRIAKFAEDNDLLPDEQYGFRAKRSCVGAASLLHKVVRSRLENKKRTYVAFIDLAKAFDKVDRTLLFAKLQKMEIPHRLCATLFYIFNTVRVYLKAGDSLSEPFQSNIGGPQGDVSSALLFSLFISDIVNHIPKIGPKINDVIVSIILYADDMCLIAESENDLQRMLDSLEEYCDENKLEVNVNKTKVMVFHRGRLPTMSIKPSYAGQLLEIVNHFCYLGFWFSVQLSYTRHVETVISKARARIGLLFAKLPLVHLPLHLVLKVFSVYIAPLFHYGLPLYMSRVSGAAMQAIDSVFTKFLKRYLCIPPSANNAILLHVTSQQPLTNTLKRRAPHQTGGLIFPGSLSGMKLSFLENIDRDIEFYDPVPLIPSAFWNTRIVTSIPVNKFYRKRLMREIFDLHHMEICTNTTFHIRPEESCVCNVCFRHAHPYHVNYCEGPSN